MHFFSAGIFEEFFSFRLWKNLFVSPLNATRDMRYRVGPGDFRMARKKWCWTSEMLTVSGGRGRGLVQPVLARLPGARNVARLHRSPTVRVFHSPTCGSWLSCSPA